MLNTQFIIIEKVTEQVKKEKKRLVDPKTGGFIIDFSDLCASFYQNAVLKNYTEALKKANLNYGGFNTPSGKVGISTNHAFCFYDTETYPAESKYTYKAVRDRDLILELIADLGKAKNKLAKKLHLCATNYSYVELKRRYDAFKAEAKKKEDPCKDNNKKQKKSRFNKVIITKDFIQHGYNFHSTPKNVQQIDVDFGDRSILFQ